jgi:hypothetical protein
MPSGSHQVTGYLRSDSVKCQAAKKIMADISDTIGSSHRLSVIKASSP